MRGTLPFALTLLAASAAPAAEEPGRLVHAVLPGTSTQVVVAEGQFEPRSVGSYSVRIYGGANPRFPYDDFIAGTVRPRDGALERVQFADVDGDRAAEIVVVMRSAGTGNYRSADTFQLHGRTLSLAGSVAGLAQDADPVRALAARLANPAAPLAVPGAGNPSR